MRSFFADTNLFIRFYAEDDLAQTRQAESVFRRAKNREISLHTGPPVFFETAWVLRGNGVPRDEVMIFLESICSLPGLTVHDQDLVLEAIHLSKSTSLEFADAYISASTRQWQLNGVATFNRKDFKKTGLELLDF